MAKNKKLTRKPWTGYLYTWTPNTDETKKIQTTKRKHFCTAIPFSNGEDWITSYTYDLVVINGEQKRLAYVECDYVK